MKMKPCPKCKSEELCISSSRSLRLSIVVCYDCSYQFQSNCYEENIPKWWNKHIKD